MSLPTRREDVCGSVPRDCVASNMLDENRQAIEEMRTVPKADVRNSEEIDFAHADA
jgi:hypothetical protein